MHPRVRDDAVRHQHAKNLPDKASLRTFDAKNSFVHGSEPLTCCKLPVTYYPCVGGIDPTAFRPFGCRRDQLEDKSDFTIARSNPVSAPHP